MSRRNDFPHYATHQVHGDGHPHPSLGNRQFGLDHRYSIGRGYVNGNPSPSLGSRELGFDRSPLSQDNRRIDARTEYRPLEARLAMRSFTLPSIPLDPYSPARIIILNNNNNMDRGRMIPMLPQFLHRQTPTGTNDESKLTNEEQEIILKKLKKEIYNPMPKMLARRVSLYYRDLNRDPNSKTHVDKQRDEDGKSCAVCLDDFEPREEVMVTPCNHMFHEECIVPWVKDHGQCPVCRYALYERMRQNSSVLNNNGNNNTGAVLPGQHDLFGNELVSLIQAVNEAFPLGA